MRLSNVEQDDVKEAVNEVLPEALVWHQRQGGQVSIAG